MDNKIKYRAGYKYQLAEDYIIRTGITPDESINHDFLYLTVTGVLAIKAGYAWDGPSGPTVDTPDFMRGSLVHDALYQLMREGLLAASWREKVDKELQLICLEDGMSWIRAAWVYAGVRIGGEKSAVKQEEKILTAP